MSNLTCFILVYFIGLEAMEIEFVLPHHIISGKGRGIAILGRKY